MSSIKMDTKKNIDSRKNKVIVATGILALIIIGFLSVATYIGMARELALERQQISILTTEASSQPPTNAGQDAALPQVQQNNNNNNNNGNIGNNAAYTPNPQVSNSTGANTTSPLAGEAFVSSKVSLPVVAVGNDGQGTMGTMTLETIPGNGKVLVSTTPYLTTDLQFSANQAVSVAGQDAGSGKDKDFVISFSGTDAELLGGGSAGSTMTLAAMAALEGKSLRSDAVLSGTINSDGTIGDVGGLLEKAQAVAKAGYHYFLIPKGEGAITYYQPQQGTEDFGGIRVITTEYVKKQVDLVQTAKNNWGLNVVEVSNIGDAMKFMAI